MSNERVDSTDFSVTSSSESMWHPHSIRKNVPLVFNIFASLLLATGAVVFKFSNFIPITYRTIECKDILPYHESSPEVSWIEIEDEFFFISAAGFAILLIMVTELAVILFATDAETNNSLSGFSKDCTRTLIPLLNGLFSVTLITSLLQRITGTIKPYFLTICPAACAWPVTQIRTKCVEEELEFCFNATSTNLNHIQLKGLLEDARMSFPSFQETILTYVIVFVIGYWHTKRIARPLCVLDALRLLFLTIMTIVLILMSHSKVVRHKCWLSDLVIGSFIGLAVAFHQMIGTQGSSLIHCSDQLTIQSKNVRSPFDHKRRVESAELKRVNIPRVTYRRSLVQRRQNQLSRDDLNRRDQMSTAGSVIFINKQ